MYLETVKQITDVENEMEQAKADLYPLCTKERNTGQFLQYLHGAVAGVYRAQHKRF